MLAAIFFTLFAIICAVIAVKTTVSGLKDKSYGMVAIVDILLAGIIYVCCIAVIGILYEIGILV